MANSSTNIRLDPKLKKAAFQLAQMYYLSFSDVVKLLVLAFVKGDISISVIHPAAKYPEGYLDMLEKEADENDILHRTGKVRSFHAAKEAMKALNNECDAFPNGQ